MAKYFVVLRKTKKVVHIIKADCGNCALKEFRKNRFRKTTHILLAEMGNYSSGFCLMNQIKKGE